MNRTYKLAGGALVVSAAFLLKSFYSTAGSEDLGWIIGPTAWVAELLSSLSFSPEPGYGWVDTERQVVIAPVCAGVNFLIISFCMSSFQILWHKSSGKDLITAIMAAGAASYLLTIVANAARILLSVSLFSLQIYNEWLTVDTVHRTAGITIYYLLLCFYSQSINRCCRGKDRPGKEAAHLIGRHSLPLIPLFWYLLFSVGVPAARLSFQADPGLFLRHTAAVGGVTLVLTLLFYGVRGLFLWIRKDHCSSCSHAFAIREQERPEVTAGG